MRSEPATLPSSGRSRAVAGLRQFFSYFGISAAALVVHYGILVIAVRGFGLGAVAGSAAGFAFGGVVSYALNHRFTFRSTRRHRTAFPTFFAVVGLGLVFNSLLMALFAEIIGLHYLLAQVMTTGLLLFWHFFAHQRWTFR